jgi:hypothetical protein
MLEELITSWEGFLALPTCELLGNCVINSQVNIVLGFTGLVFLSKKTHLLTDEVSLLL